MRNMYLLSLGLLLSLTENIMMDCDVGQKKRRGSCVDDNECESELNICGKNANCFNTNGSYYCHCERGFTPTHNFTQMDKTECQDINECVDGSADCGPNAECVNSEGDYSCTCETGYSPSDGKEVFIAGQGVQCIDRIECDDSSVCGINATCHNIPGSFYCICAEGFRLKSGKTNFTESDEPCMSECDIDKSICEDGICQNSKDGHECVCMSGFTNYGHKQMKCTELKCDTFISESKGSQASPELTELVSLMTNSCLGLSANESVRNERFTQVDGKILLEAFMKALDDLLHGGFKGNNHQLSALFNLVENMLKLIGPLLSESPTKRSSTETELELLVKRGSSPPEGDFNISTSSTQFASHWDTATGNTYLGFSTAALLSYKGLGKSLQHFFNHLERQTNQTFKINSKLLTATVSNTETANLKKSVTLTFSHLERSNENHTCVFWDPDLEGGAWSKEGCTTVSSSDVQTVCSCNHLSSFAVLMALYDIGVVYELSLITWVGLPLSLVCLLICIATFYFVRSIQSTRNTIHLHLCVSLFIAYFVFLVGIARTENKVGCAVVAGVLHYFFLASFCWMCLEGVQLFRMVVLVFNTTLRPIYMFASGYGVPAVIVAISATAHPSGYGTNGYCWLNFEDGFIWSFYGPVCAIIIVNVLFFLITIWKLAEKFSSLNPDLNNLRKIKAFTVTAIAQLCVLGIMWVFGCFQFNKDTLAMSYIFTILSSLQGVLMFIMHCWLSKQVREEYAKFLSCICAPQKRQYSEFGSNQTSKSQASKSVQHTGESNI
ncbi:adhesion G protein-coupled receptor E5 [Siphateles boraxobius]|uniref:adhesion G protein-coupled receptor E5 n=1 Tax=Siphateles boraxobius TaxID=180520 RepID=UPI004063E19B